MRRRPRISNAGRPSLGLLACGAMLETLTKGFRSARDRFRGVVELSDANIADALSDVRASLLEADVDLGIVREFLAKVQERVVGERVRIEAGKKSGQKLRVSPGDHFTKACYEELVALMGEGQPIEPAKGRTRALMLLGPAGHRARPRPPRSWPGTSRSRATGPCSWRPTCAGPPRASSCACWARRSACPSSRAKATTPRRSAPRRWPSRASTSTARSSSTPPAGCRSTTS